MPAGEQRERQAALRRAEVLRLRVQGLSNLQIAQRLGISDSRASRLYHDALDRTVAEPAAEARKLELERLDDLIVKTREVLDRFHYVLWAGEIVLDQDGQPLHDDGPTLQALDRLIRLSETRRRLLGLDAPTRLKHEITGLDEVEDEIRELRAERERRTQLRLLQGGGGATGTDDDGTGPWTGDGPVGDPH